MHIESSYSDEDLYISAWFDDKLNTSIFHQCADKDLVHRLSGLKQHPETGQLYNRDQWQREEVFNKKKENKDGEVEDEEEQVWLNGEQLLPLGLNFLFFTFFSQFIFSYHNLKLFNIKLESCQPMISYYANRFVFLFLAGCGRGTPKRCY